MKELFDIIDRIALEIKKIWIEMAKIETPSDDKESIDSLVEFLFSYATKLGFKPVVHPFCDSGNGLVITSETETELQPVALMAHMDTVHKKGLLEKHRLLRKMDF